MTETENADAEIRLRRLEQRIEHLEKQVAALSRAKKPAPPGGATRSYRDSFDALDYPER